MEREKREATKISEQLECLLNQQIEYAEKTKLRVFECLERVSFPPEPTCDKLTADENQWPPFFDNMRSGLYQISEALDAINRAIDRCGL